MEEDHLKQDTTTANLRQGIGQRGLVEEVAVYDRALYGQMLRIVNYARLLP